MASKNICPLLSTGDGRSYKDVVTASRRGDAEKNVRSRLSTSVSFLR